MGAVFHDSNGRGKLGIISLRSCEALGENIDAKIRFRRRNNRGVQPDSYLIDADQIRFADGEGKVMLLDSVRGKDVYILCDVGNYSCTYKMFGITNHMSPDEHFQDVKRTVSAIGGRSRRTTLIMPKLYAARQDRRKGRESLDCAMALSELSQMGVKDIITFDVHDSRVQNAVPLCSFDNLYATYEIVKTFMADERDVVADKDNMLIISPDSGAMDRAIYYSSVLDIDVGLFYKRRDYSRLERGKYPIVQHEYMGRDIQGKNIIIIDDMIASGESMLDIIAELKRRKAGRIFIAATFSLFVEGLEKFDDYYNEGLFDKIYTTNLTYISEEAKTREWLEIVDMSDFLATLIDLLNQNVSIAPLFDSTNDLKELIMNIRSKS